MAPQHHLLSEWAIGIKPIGEQASYRAICPVHPCTSGQDARPGSATYAGRNDPRVIRRHRSVSCRLPNCSHRHPPSRARASPSSWALCCSDRRMCPPRAVAYDKFDNIRMQCPQAAASSASLVYIPQGNLATEIRLVNSASARRTPGCASARSRQTTV